METGFDEAGCEALREEAKFIVCEVDGGVVGGYEGWFGAVGEGVCRGREEKFGKGGGGDGEGPAGVDGHFEGGCLVVGSLGLVLLWGWGSRLVIS